MQPTAGSAQACPHQRLQLSHAARGQRGPNPGWEEVSAPRALSGRKAGWLGLLQDSLGQLSKASPLGGCLGWVEGVSVASVCPR